MQNWRKGIKPVVSRDGREEINSPKPGSVVLDTTPLKFEEDESKSDTLNNKTAPLQFFNTCSSLSKSFIGYFPKDADVLKPTLAMMGFGDDKVDDENAIEMGKYMMTSFYDLFNENFDKILEKNDLFFELDNEILQSMNVKEKWSKLTQEQKDSSWKDMILLVQLTNIDKMYNLCPPGMMDMVTSMAQKVSKQVQSGEINMTSLNPMEIGQSMVSSMSEDQIQEIGKSLMKKENLEGMMKLMQTSMKGMQNAGLPPNFDMSNLGGDLSMLSSLLGQK
jgi:hypothetical protein